MAHPSKAACDAAFTKFVQMNGSANPGDILRAAYPTIRADVIAEVVARLRDMGVHRTADTIEREFGEEASR
jgi:hypothetical protein